MSRLLAPYALRDFSGGLNNKDEPYLIPDNMLVDVNNAILGRGVISKRHGYVKYTPISLANPITLAYDFFRNNGTTELLAVSNNTLYKDAAGTLGAIPFSVITSLTSSNVKAITYKDRTINDVVLFADTGKLKVYNGTNVAEVTPYAPTTAEQTNPGLNDLANLTSFRALAIKKDRIFAAAHPTVKNRIHFCYRDPAIGYATYDYWPAAFFIDVASEENDEIVDLKVFRDALLIFCKRSVWLLTGDGTTMTDYQLHKVNVPKGCVSSNSVTVVGNNIFYLSDDHIYSLFATDQNYVSAEIVSYNIEKTLQGITLADKQKAVGTYFDNKYYLSFPDGTTLVFDTLLKNWTKWSNVKANSFINRSEVLYFTTNTGYIYKFDPNVFSDDGVAISFSMKTKNMDFGAPVQIKKLKRIWTIAKQYDALSSTYDLNVIADYLQVSNNNISTDQSGVWDEGDWDSVQWDFKDVVKSTHVIKVKAEYIQVEITNNVIDQPLSIYEIVFRFKMKKPK